jgi:hypothetical protein
MSISVNGTAGNGTGNATSSLYEHSAYVNASGIGCDWNLKWEYCTIENDCCYAILQQNARTREAY